MMLIRNAPARPRSSRRHGLPTVAVTAVALAVLAGCTGGGGTNPGPDQPGGDDQSAAPSETPAATLPKGVKPAKIPDKVANDPNDRKNVVLTACESAKSGWQASGTATNPGKEDVKYEITVFFTTTSATTINSASVDVSVKPGETAKWSAKQEFTAPKEMLCVLRGVAAT